MASFTDQIMQSRPYVQQLPLEAMAQVGMYKQQKYEEGVMKIQNQIDNIAGMDVYKPIHKKYLQSKLNELGSKLKTVAGSDFSNFQLVNSVGGMANQIVRDPTIQNALASTQHIRKQQSEIETARKAGKSNPDNEDYFYDQLTRWANDGNLKSSFNDSFVQYKDVDGKLRELTSKLKEDETHIENPYMRDEQGNTLYYYRDPKTGREVASLDPSKGQKKLDFDMLAVTVKGLPAQRILNNFYNSLDANDIQQLKITSWAHYRGVGPERFEPDIKAAYNDKVEMRSQEKIDLAVKLQDPKISAITKAKLEARLNEINSDIENKVLEKELNDNLAELRNPKDLEDFKYRLYTQTHLTGLAKDLANRSYVQERKANPAEQADLARKKFQFDQVQEANKNYWERKKYDLEVEKFEHQKEKEYADKVKQGYIVTPGSWGTGLKAPTITDLEKDMTDAANSYQDTQNQFANLLFKSSDPQYKNMSLNEKRKALDKLSSDYRQNPNMSLTPDQQEYLEQIRQVGNNLTHTINAVTAARNKDVEFRQNYISEKLKNEKVTAGGVTYTGSDIADFNDKLNKFTTVYRPTNVNAPTRLGPVSTFDDDAAEAFYKTYKGGKFLPMFNAYNRNEKTFTILSADEKALVNFSDKIKKSTFNIDDAASQAVSHFIATNSPKYAVQRAAINMADPTKVAQLDQFLATKQAQFNEKGMLDVNDVAEYNPATSGKLRLAPGTSFVIEKKKDGNANVIMMGADNTRQIIPAKAAEVAAFFPQVAVTSPFAMFKDAIITSPTRTTNSGNTRFKPGSGSGAVNAMISGFQLPQLSRSGYESKVRIDVEGFEGNLGDPLTDKYSVIMYVPDPNTGMWKGDYISGGYVSESDAVNVISKISPQNINQAIKTFR